MKIKEYIAQKGITAREFARMVGVSETSISFYSSDPPQRLPRPGKARRIIAASGGAITWDDIYQTTDHPA